MWCRVRLRDSPGHFIELGPSCIPFLFPSINHLVPITRAVRECGISGSESQRPVTEITGSFSMEDARRRGTRYEVRDDVEISGENNEKAQ